MREGRHACRSSPIFSGPPSGSRPDFGVRRERVERARRMLAALREPSPVDGWRDALSRWPMVAAALSTRPQIVAHPDCQHDRRLGADVDILRLPIQTCWPGEPAPLITWPLVITRPPDTDARRHAARQCRRLSDAGACGRPRDPALADAPRRRGSLSRLACAGQGYAGGVAIGADPATILSAVLPLPETVSELRFSGVLRGERPRLAPALTVPLDGSRGRRNRHRGMGARRGDRARRPLRRSHRLLQQPWNLSRSCASPRSRRGAIRFT